MKTGLCIAAFAVLATSAQAAETELWFRNAERKGLAQALRARGLDCLELQAGFQIAWQGRGAPIRVVCRPAAGRPGQLSMFRLITRGSGISRMEPWEKVLLAEDDLRPSLE